MKVVLDTNVLIAALIAKGVCTELLQHCVLRHHLVSSEHILSESREHLAGKFRFAQEDAEAAVSLFRTQMEIVAPRPLPQPVCRDADDDLVLASAIAGNADCIVTGDKDLLVLQSYQGIAIVSPSRFAELEAQRE